MIENQVFGEIIDSSIKIHKALGPGLLESVYETVLAFELRKRGFEVSLQVPVPVCYEGVSLEVGFRCDMIVNDLVIVELKSVENVLPVHNKQLLTYLRLTGKRLGLLINFNNELMKDGIVRIVN